MLILIYVTKNIDTLKLKKTNKDNILIHTYFDQCACRCKHFSNISITIFVFRVNFCVTHLVCTAKYNNKYF